MLRPHANWLALQVVAALLFGFIAARGSDAVRLTTPPAPDWRDTFATIVRTRFNLEITRGTTNALSTPSRTLSGIFRSRDVVFAARKPGALCDLFRARVRFDPEGQPLAVGAPLNLTQTEAADESVVAWAGPRLFREQSADDPVGRPRERNGEPDGTEGEPHRLAFAARVADRFQGLTLLDFAGEPPALTSTWPLIERLKNRISNWQKTGALRGVAETIFEFRQPPPHVTLAFDGPALVVTTTDDTKKARSIRVSAAGDRTGDDLLEPVPRVKSPTEHIQWAVNTVRELSFVGHELIAWLEQRVYRAQDDIRNVMNRLGLISTKPSNGASASVTTEDDEEVPTSDVVAPTAKPQPSKLLGLDDTWPPTPVPLMKSPKWKQPVLRGEGEWTAIGEPIIRTRPGLAPPFYKTFVRTDPDREYARVVLAVADVRQLEIYMLAGTEHPQPTTGHKGTGLIPREPDTMSRLVAAFNGGFQAMHGKAGMVVDRKTLLYPVPGLGTIATKDNGDIVFLTWPKTKEVPREFKSLRQNLAALVENGRFNPRGQKRWGYALPGGDSIFVHRSAIGVTKDGYLIYAFGPSLSPETLAEGMLRAGTVFAIHLDMNPWHCAFEFFKVFDTVGKKYKSTKLDPAQVFKFPRYLSRSDPRDFFYLTYRKGHDLLLPFLDSPWSAATLPAGGGGLPPAWAETTVRTSKDATTPNLTLLSLAPDRIRADIGFGAAEPRPATGMQPPAAIAGWPQGGGYGLAIDLGRTDAEDPRGLMVADRVVFPPRHGAPTIAVTRAGEISIGSWGTEFAGTGGLRALKQGTEHLIVDGRAANLSTLPDRALPMTVAGSIGNRLIVASGIARPAALQETLLRAGVRFAFTLGTTSPRAIRSTHPKPENLDLSSSHLFLRALPSVPRASVTAYKQ